tara:strand:- start:1046 stop:6577 length:5532 start_codon:yes stop_codon:yes gene_type:complete
MDDPVKLIYKYKNLNNRIQYELFIFVGFYVDEGIKKILNKIKDLNFYDALIELTLDEINKLKNIYGEKWFLKFYILDHLELTFNLIEKTDFRRKEIQKKFGSKWIENNINIFSDFEKSMYSFQYLFNKERELRQRSKRFRERRYRQMKDLQKGGEYNENDDNFEEKEEDDLEASYTLDKNKTFDEVDEFDLDELENIHKEVEIDDNLASTSKLIDKIMKNDEKNVTSKNKLIKFPTTNNENTYDGSLKNVFKKSYIYEQYIFNDDTILKIKEKICCSIELNDMFVNSGNLKHKAYLSPNRIYLWSKYSYLDIVDSKSKISKIMLGQKWIRKNELLNIDIEPNNNIKVYEDLRGEIGNIKQDLKKHGSRIRREEDDNSLLEDYKDKSYIRNNEIYMIDIFHELNLNYNPSNEKIKNLYDVYIKLYFFHLNSEDLKQILNYLNINDERNRKYEINYMKNVYNTINNDLIIENEVVKTIETYSRKSKKNIFKSNYITHAVIHTYLGHSNTFNNSSLDLFRIFDNFVMNKDYPFLNYQLVDGKLVYKFFIDEIQNNKDDVKTKWFESAPFGISFKLKIDILGLESSKFIAISLNENARLEYKVQFKEEDKATVDDIKKTYKYIKNLIIKINNENDKLKINIPEDEDFKYAFINSIQKFEFESNKSINHNNLSEFCRYFYPYVSLVIEPRKRDSKNIMKESKSKFGTYLRYKRVSKYENEAKIEHRIIYFIKNYEFTDVTLIKEIAKQFNLTEKKAAEQIKKVREKFPVIKTARKILKKLDSAPKYNHPGIGIDIQGKSRFNYKIRISGSRNKNQLNRIIKFMNVLIYLYIETYINKNSVIDKIKSKLSDLSDIAKRRHKVDDIVDLEDLVVKDVKRLTNFDSDRLGYRPEEGASHWTRSCQNSGKKKRQPQFYVYSSLDELLKKGYIYNEKTKYYEKKVKRGKKEIILRAAEQENVKDKSNNIFYVCDPEVNNEYMHVGFLSKSKNPNDLCEPCCFKKDPLESNNKDKKNYYLRCMGRIKDDNVKKINKIDLDKIYILQDTNKIQSGRFGFLPASLDFFLNVNLNNSVIIKNHYLVNTNKTYLFKYGVNISDIPFINTISNIYDISNEDIINKIYKILNDDKNDIFFNSLNSGDLRTQFKTRDKFLNFLKTNKRNINHEILLDLISKPNIISPNGINFYIFEKETNIIKSEFEKKQIKEDFNLICSNYEDDIYRTNSTRDNVLMLKDGKIYFPIFEIDKQKSNQRSKITKYFKFNNVIKQCLEFYNLGCNNETNINLSNSSNRDLNYSCKIINEELTKLNKNKYNIKYQYIDTRNKCRYIILNNNYLIPVYPSGSLHNVDVIYNIDKYVKSFDKAIEELIDFNSNVSLDFIPNGFLFTDKNNDKYKINALLINNTIEIKINSDYFNENKIISLAKKLKRTKFLKVNNMNENIIDENIINNKIIYDDRIIQINKRLYNNESYELFRLELNNYLNLNTNIKDKIIKILNNNKINNKDRSKLLKLLIYKYIDSDLHSLIMSGGSNKILNINDEDVNYENIKINNKREICNSNINKELCNKNINCKWKSNSCKFTVNSKQAINFVNKVVNELIYDDMKSKEILSLSNYYVDDIVDFTHFSRREGESIIKNDLPNMNEYLNKIFGENNIPIIGKKKFYITGKSIFDDNLNNPIEKIGNMFIQNLIPNNYTILRAFCNSYYWINNNLLNKKSRNLGYYSDLQTNLTNYFIGSIISFLSDENNKSYIFSNLEKYINLSINSYIQNLSTPNNFYQNGIIELTILSKIYNICIVILNNYFDIIYIFKNGVIIYDSQNSKQDIKKYNNEDFLKNNIVILYDYSIKSSKPNKIKSIYF